jgi:hypothetical protein
LHIVFKSHNNPITLYNDREVFIKFIAGFKIAIDNDATTYFFDFPDSVSVIDLQDVSYALLTPEGDDLGFSNMVFIGDDMVLDGGD